MDSNLDWGQDALRLADARCELQLEPLAIDILTSFRFVPHGLPAREIDANIPVHGWLAVSETQLVLKRAQGGYGWLDPYRPAHRIGKSIRLYWLP